MLAHNVEVARGERFEFGRNWARFLEGLNENRIETAERHLCERLERATLEGLSFLDIGSGSGIFSLAARRLGARVHSFDYDPQSVGCTAELKRRYFPEDARWKIERGSALDEDYIRSLGLFDIVYSWGVLHHTGDMWRALDYARYPVRKGGKLFIAIYNDMGSQTERWRWIKKTYNRLPRPLRVPFAGAAAAPDEARAILKHLLTLRLGDYIRLWTRSEDQRGMSRWRDIIDWVGGLPYEAAAPDRIFDFYRARGFELTKILCKNSLGCNEFVFQLSK
jgi:2-polyprenyl-3-methyl-5-hydroxy-6-metoxy-1,4-benzoquinol methylase